MVAGRFNKETIMAVELPSVLANADQTYADVKNAFKAVNPLVAVMVDQSGAWLRVLLGGSRGADVHHPSYNANGEDKWTVIGYEDLYYDPTSYEEMPGDTEPAKIVEHVSKLFK